MLRGMEEHPYEALAFKHDDRDIRLLVCALTLAQIVLIAPVYAWLYLAYPRVMEDPDAITVIVSSFLGWSLITSFINLIAMISFNFARMRKRFRRHAPVASQSHA